MTRPEITEKLRRILYREFLLEPGLYREVGLDDLPLKVASLLNCSEGEAIETLLTDPLLGPLTLDQLKSLFLIRDMGVVSRTAAAVAAELKDPSISFEACCRTALCYAVIGQHGHVYSALRAAAGKNDSWARHHYFYALILGISGDSDRALWELNMALQFEPYEDGRIRIRWAMDILDGKM